MEMRTKKIIRLELGIIVLIIAGFVVFNFIPRLSQIFSMRKKLIQAQRSARFLSEKEKTKIRKELAEHSQFLESGFASLKEISQYVNRKIIDQKDLPRMTLLLEDLAAAAKIELLSIKPLSTEIQGEYEYLPIILEFQCTYPQLLKFLSQWDKFHFFIAFQEVKITKTKSLGSNMNIRLTVKGLFDANAKKEILKN